MLTVNLSSVNVEQRTVSVIAGGAVIALINAHRAKNIQESVVRYIEGSVLFYCNIICASYHTVMHFYALCKMRRCSESLEMMESTNDVSQFSELLQAFRDRYNCEAEYVVKSPGRINIIGEHIDYSGYPVLPMAVDECIYAAFSVNQNSEEITVCNTDPKYEPFEALYSYFITSCKNLSWKDYFLTGVVAAMDHIEEYQYKASEDAEVKLTFKGFKAMISNKLPERRGFAISTALVCCAAACTMVAVGDGNFRTITKENLAELCSQYENADLVRGPMDNLICFTARQGAFNPLRLDDVTLPPNARFLVFHCGLQSTKNAMFPLFRKRVTECRLATK
ncbi:Tat pathway signal sequence domain protein, partial [Trichinella nativa]